LSIIPNQGINDMAAELEEMRIDKGGGETTGDVVGDVVRDAGENENTGGGEPA
jgi:hypothetical protein